ncbi:ABC transporter permease subunit [Pseudooceanicola sp. 216_PA32_1]|uniref:ABC transporter permease subunit n=1 Tax=Pseudooceanicola pacificus TaxID=2676438 RepID=A0A844WFH8_9RHOB|nr:sugar ABC transporter permease [Pseudooceanicola pacificus]MWB79170.1 ABC transporter permease subunit [Pseudooceanicola pacificus]
MVQTFDITNAMPGRATARRVVLQPWVYLAPTLATLVVWIYWPLIEALYLSFFQWNMLPTATPRYVGLDNYANLLTLPEMRRAAWNTVLYILGLLPLSVVLPTAVAMLTQDLSAPFRNLYRSLIFIPMIIAPIVAAVLWRWLLNDDHGLVNAVLETVGLSPVGFLKDPSIALWTLVWITGWKLIGFATLLLSAANGSIDPGYVEAARMDGATRWQVIRDIRLPLLSPTILLLTMMTILFGAQWSFVYINALTGGGPLQSTTNVFYLMWDYGFQSYSAGWSATAGILTFAGFGVIAVLCLWLMRRFAVHEG